MTRRHSNRKKVMAARTDLSGQMDALGYAVWALRGIKPYATKGRLPLQLIRVRPAASLRQVRRGAANIPDPTPPRATNNCSAAGRYFTPR